MKLSQDELVAINTIINPLLGQVAWNVKLGVGSFITMEFGQTHSVSQKKRRGEWYLWVYCCGWYLENPNGPFIGSEDPRNILKQEITTIEGHKLENVIISPIGLETVFIFDRELILHTFPLNFIEKYAYWKLFTPGDRVLVLGSGKIWSYEKSSEAQPH